MRPSRPSTAAALLTLSLLLAACGGALANQKAGDKAGNETVPMTLATIDKVNNNGQSYGPQAFVDALSEVSEGELDVEVDLVTYAQGGGDDETELVEAMASGDLDGGWPSVRAFGAAGIDGLDVVEAPFTLTSYDAVKDLVSSSTADKLLRRLEGTGVVGLALAVGPPRRPFSAEAPLVDPADWDGLTMRSYNSPVQDATIRALGAEPVSVGFDWPALMQSGELDGLEFDVAQYYENGTTDAANLPTNVVLWSKVFVLAVSQDFWDSLSDEQQGWVRESAEKSRDVSVEATYDEQSLLPPLCQRGLTLQAATEEQLNAYRQAVQPVLDQFADDPLLDEIEAIAARHPEPEALEAPPACSSQASMRIADPGPPPATPTGLPNGTYRVDVSQQDIVDAGFGEDDASAGLYTLTVRDGRYQIDCAPISPPGNIDCWYGQVLPADFDWNPREVGTVTGNADTAYFAHDPELEAQLTDCDPDTSGQPSSCGDPWRTRVAWTLDGDSLTFSDQVATEPNYPFAVKPWTKIK
jgi:TRAP-type C4-dicarboxylate transport system substrate-binding protein